MSDSRRCSNADSENMREKNYKNLFAALAPIQVLALLVSLKSANSILWVKVFTQNAFYCVFASIPTVLETLRTICSSK
jgi:hypothetical protein